MRLNRLLAPLVLLLAVGLGACDDVVQPTAVEVEDPQTAFLSYRSGPTIADIAIELASDPENPEFTILVQALAEADLVGVLDGRRNYTVFAPTDAAFGRLLELLDMSAEELLADTDLLRDVLLYHVASGRRYSDRVLRSNRIRTLNKDYVYPRANDMGAFIVDGSPATADAQLQAPDLIDIKASNGVIHVIDEVLVPPTLGGGDQTIADIAIALASDEENPEFTILTQALAAADLVDALDGYRRYTVFAPTDAAFGRLLELLDVSAEDLLSNKELLQEVLLYHVVRGSRISWDVLAAENLKTLNGERIMPAITGEGAFIIDGATQTEDAQLLAPDLIDIQAKNGVIHVIDEVLLPSRFNPPSDGGEEPGEPGEPTIAGLVASLASAENPEFTILLAALQRAELVGALDGEDILTVFAPTDAAFTDLLDRLHITPEQLLSSKQLLKYILLYHVTPGAKLSGEVLDSNRIHMLNGRSVKPAIKDGAPVIVDRSRFTRDAALLAPDLIDIQVANGVVHVIDAVLLPF